MLVQKRKEQLKAYEKQEKRIKELKASGVTKKQAVSYMSLLFENLHIVFRELYDTLNLIKIEFTELYTTLDFKEFIKCCIYNFNSNLPFIL